MDLPDVEQQFIADVTRWLAGVEAMIEEGREFIKNNAEMIASVDALESQIEHLDGKDVKIGLLGVGEDIALAEELQQKLNAIEDRLVKVAVIYTNGDFGKTDGDMAYLDNIMRDIGADAVALSNTMRYMAVGEEEVASAMAEGNSVMDRKAAKLNQLKTAIEEVGLSDEDLARLADESGAAIFRQGEQAKNKTTQLVELMVSTGEAAIAEQALAEASNNSGEAAASGRVRIGWYTMSLTTLHWIISGTIEVLAVLIPALVAMGAAADVGLQGVTETADRMKSLYSVTESLGGAFGVTGGMVYGLKGNLQAAQDAADPKIWELLGEGVKAVGDSSGWFITMGTQVINILDAFGARLDVDVTGNMKQMQSVLGDGAKDLAGFGQVFGNLGMAIFSAASQMPGLAEVLLGLLSDITRFISVVVQLSGEFRFMGVSILTITMGIEEFMRWGGLLVSMMSRMGIATTDLGDKFLSFQRFQGVFMSLALAIPNAGVAITAGLSGMAAGMADMFDKAAVATAEMPLVSGAMITAGDAAQSASIGLADFSAGLGAAIAELSFFQVAIGVGLVAALVIGILYLNSTTTATQRFISKLQDAANTATFGQGMIDAANNMAVFSQKAEQATQQVQQLGTEQTKALSWHGLQEGTAAANLHSATQAMQEYTQASQQAAQQEGNAISAVIAISQKYGVTMPEALALANTANLKLGTSLTTNGQLTATAAAEVAGLVSGYEVMSGSALGLGNNVAAVNAQLGLQGSQLSKVNGAWDQFLANAIGGTQAYATLNDDISTMGNVTTDATSKITSFAQQSQGMSLSVKQISEALKTYGAQSSQVWQNYDSALTQAGTVTDWWRTAAASGTVTGTQLNEMIADTANQLLPFAKNSTTAASELGVLVQEAGGPALTNYQALKNWIDQNITSQDEYNKLLGQTTSAMSNVSNAAAQFSQTMDAMVVTAVEQGSVNLGQITTDAKNFNDALKQNPADTTAVTKALNSLVGQLYGANIGAANVKSMVQQMGANMHLSAGQTQELANEAYDLYQNLDKIHNVSATVSISEDIHTTTTGSATGPIANGRNYVPGVATGGRIPGYGGGDIVPAMLEPGEAVVPKHLVPGVAGYLGSHGVPGFAKGGVVETPMEKVIAQWAGEVWKQDLKAFGKKGPIGLSEMESLFGPSKFPNTGIWKNPQYRDLRLDERKDMDPYYVKDIAYSKVASEISSLKSSEASQIANWKYDQAHYGTSSNVLYWSKVYRNDISYAKGKINEYEAKLRGTTDAKLRADYTKDIAKYTADLSKYQGDLSKENTYYSYAGDISRLEKTDAAKLREFQEELKAISRSMGYAQGGLVPFGHYDQGGYLPMGLSMAYNGTGRPEPVGGGDAGTMHVHIEVGGKQIADAILPSVVAATARYGIRNSGRATGLLRPS